MLTVRASAVRVWMDRARTTRAVSSMSMTESVAVSPEQFAFFRERGYAVELVYPGPVQVHTRYFFPAAPRL